MRRRRLPFRGRGERRGFTVVELLLVAAIVSILARIAIPNLTHVIHRARAADLVSDVRLIQGAAIQYLGEHHRFPPDADAGVVPPGLRPHLPDGFSFRTEGWTLDWDLWTLPDGLPSDRERLVLPAVTAVPHDRPLVDALRWTVGEGPWLVLGESFTYLVLE